MTIRAAHAAELAADKDKVVAHYAAQERQAAEEAQMKRDADSWHRLKAAVAIGEIGPESTHNYIRALMSTIELVSLVRS